MVESQQLTIKLRLTPTDLQILMIRKKVKQVDIANKAGVSKSVVSPVCNGIECSSTVENAAGELLDTEPRDIWPLVKPALPAKKTPQ